MEQENFKINGEQLTAEEEAKTVEKVKEMRDFLYGLKGKRLEVHKKIIEITEELRKKYPDLDQTYLFHVIIFSSMIKRQECVRFDLPGEDSIVKRLEGLVKEYQAE